MKKISLIIITIITLSSCSTQIITGTSFKEYNHSINDVSIDLLNNGYELVNHNTGTNTNSTFTERVDVGYRREWVVTPMNGSFMPVMYQA